MNRVACCLTIAVLAGCLGTESGNPPAAPTKLGLWSSDPSIAAIAVGSGVQVVTEAFVSIASIRVVTGELCDGTSAEGVDALVGDLARGVSTDGLPVGDGCGVAVSLARTVDVPPDAPPVLLGHSALVRGTRADGMPFEITTDAEPVIDVVIGTPGIALREDTAVILSFDVARWLGGVSLDALAPDPDGVVRVGPGHADAELALFEMGFVGSLALFGDTDADGILDPAEEAAGALATSHGP